VVLIGGDGDEVRRRNLPVSREKAFATTSYDLKYPLGVFQNWRPNWIRMEVWDIAGNGAVTPAIWFEDK
jgi:hypothetical protein